MLLRGLEGESERRLCITRCDHQVLLEGDHLIFQHRLTGSRVSSLWITDSFKENSRDLQGWKGNSPNISLSFSLSGFTFHELFTDLTEFFVVKCLKSQYLEIKSEDSRLKIMCYDEKIM